MPQRSSQGSSQDSSQDSSGRGSSGFFGTTWLSLSWLSWITSRPLTGEGTLFPFMRWRRGMLLFSLCLVLLSIASVLGRGLNFGIDFRGGLLLEFETTSKPDLSALRSTMRGVVGGNVVVQEFGSERVFLLRVQKPKLASGEEWDPQRSIDHIKGALEGGVSVVEYRRVETVGPAVGAELRRAAALAVALSLAGIMVYIWLRFEWQFALAAVLALVHDVVLTVGFFALFQIEFALSSVAALLAIAGYSINDTVVIFDRIREMMRKYKKEDRLVLFDWSLNRTLSRTVLTSVTTLLAIAALVFFGGSVIGSFALALGWGVIVGTYSSVGLAVPLLVLLGTGGEEGETDAKQTRA